MGLRDDILGKQDLPRKEVSVPEWTDEKLFVRTMTGAERDSWESWYLANRDEGSNTMPPNFRACLIVRVLENEDGERVFSDADAAAVGGKSSKVLNRLYDQASALNNITEKDAKDLEGNSESGQSDDSG